MSRAKFGPSATFFFLILVLHGIDSLRSAIVQVETDDKQQAILETHDTVDWLRPNNQFAELHRLYVRVLQIAS